MKILAILSLALCAFATTVPVAADDFSALSGLQKVDDSSLATMRGKYVPAEGQVTYFGVQMITSWNVQGSHGTQGVSVGTNVGIDAVNHTITISDWSSSKNGGLPTLDKDGNTVDGASPTVNIDGVGQSIQIAGDSNDVSNGSTLTISDTTPSSSIVPTTTTCGSVCTTTIGFNSIGVSIQTPEGTASQQIGLNGVTQNVQLAGNNNAISNTLQMTAQVKGLGGFNPGNLLPILRTVNGL